MRWTRWVTWTACAAIFASALMVWSCASGGGSKSTASGADKITRGATLAWTSGCMDCHTPGAMYGAPDSTRLLSGSELGWVGPWGVTFPRNLTPDQVTGIGSWTEEQIVAAIRQGHRPDGSVIQPPMPWASFSHFSDADAYALAAYLKSIPAIEHKMPDAVPPGGSIPQSVLMMPAPPAWDAQNLPPPSSTGAPPPSGTIVE